MILISQFLNSQFIIGGFHMPWVRQEDCTGCGDCIEECPVEA
ncbi:MAG: ferredoxin-type protein NapF, partial [Deltaproteobacteria bacterium]